MSRFSDDLLLQSEERVYGPYVKIPAELPCLPWGWRSLPLQTGGFDAEINDEVRAEIEQEDAWNADQFPRSIPTGLPPQPWSFAREHWLPSAYSALRLSRESAEIDAANVEQTIAEAAAITAAWFTGSEDADSEFRTAARDMGAISEDWAQAVDRLVTIRRTQAARLPDIPLWTGADTIEPEIDRDIDLSANHAGGRETDSLSLTLLFAQVRAIESFATKVSMRLAYLGDCCRDADMDRARLFYRCANIVRDEAGLE